MHGERGTGTKTLIDTRTKRPELGEKDQGDSGRSLLLMGEGRKCAISPVGLANERNL